MSIAIIVAQGIRGEIGNNNTLPWEIKEDLKYFKQITDNQFVVLGRKTYESIHDKLGKPLPNRTNIVLRKTMEQPNYSNVFVVRDKEYIINNMNQANTDLIIIGGKSIYKEFLPVADKLYITQIYSRFVADSFFPDIDYSEWKITSQRDGKEENEHKYKFLVYERKNGISDLR